MEGEVLTTWQKLNKIIGMIDPISKWFDEVNDKLDDISDRLDDVEVTQKEMKQIITAFAIKTQPPHSDIEFLEE